MPQIAYAKIIVLDNANPWQIQSVHTLVTTHATAWWHHVPHVWIIGDNNLPATWWRDQIQPLIQALPYQVSPTVLVLKLPPGGLFSQRDWAYFGPSQANEIGWLNSEYQG